MQSYIAKGVEPLSGALNQNSVGRIRALTFEEALQDIVSLNRRGELQVAKNLKISHQDWRKEKYHADTALSLWDEICRLNPIVSLASLNDRRLGRALKAAEVIRAHPFTQVRDIYEISYDMWLASAQYQHLKIVERESHLSPSAPRRDFTKDFVLSRNMKEPIAGLKLRRLVDPGYPRYLKDLKNQLTSLKKLLKHKVSKAKKPQSQ